MKRNILFRIVHGGGLYVKYYFFDIPRAKVNEIKFKIKKRKADKLREDDRKPIFEKGDYRSNKISRFILRWAGFLFNTNRIIKNRRCKVLVVVHLFYMKSTDEIVEYLKNLRFYNYDLVITYIDGCYKQQALEKIEKFKPNTIFKKYENAGYDVGPFVDVINDVDLAEYDVVMKMQSKSTKKITFIYRQFFKNRDWFKDLWNGVLGCFSVHRTIDKLYRGNYKIVAARNLIIHDPWHKQEMTKKVLEELGIRCKKNYYFVAGSCFAIKSGCLDELKKLGLKIEDFGARNSDFSLAHVVERMVCFCADEKQFYGNRVDYWRRIKWGKVEEKLVGMSGLEVLDKVKGDYEISLDFMWHTIEHVFLSDAVVENMKVGEIKRKHVMTGKIIPLDECEPYLYLVGGKQNIKKYEKYCEFHSRNGLPNMSVHRFNELIDNIKKHGYDKKKPIVVTNEDIVWDGQHRACILLYLKGGDYVTSVIKLFPIDIDILKIRPFIGWVPIIKSGK